MKKSLTVLLMLLASGALYAEVEIHSGYVRATPPGVPHGAAFLVMENHGEQALKLEGAQADAAKRVELHQHLHDNGVMRMRPVRDGIPLPPGAHTQLAPGGYHLMLMDLVQPLHEGDSLMLRLNFSDGSELDVTLPVRAAGYREPLDHSHE